MQGLPVGCRGFRAPSAPQCFLVGPCTAGFEALRLPAKPEPSAQAQAAAAEASAGKQLEECQRGLEKQASHHQKALKYRCVGYSALLRWGGYSV